MPILVRAGLSATATGAAAAQPSGADKLALGSFGRGAISRSMNKKQFSERDMCTKFITPSLRKAGWAEMTQLREEVTCTKGRIIVRVRRV